MDQRDELSAHDRATLENIRTEAQQAHDARAQVVNAGLLDATSAANVLRNLERLDEAARDLERRHPDNAEIRALRRQLDAWKNGRNAS